MIEIKDSFLDEEYFSKLKKEFTSSYFPWYLNHEVSLDNDGHIQMTHMLYRYNEITSDYYDLLKPLLSELKVFSLVRMKMNLLYRTDKLLEHGFHIDITDAPKNLKTSIFYFNSNNGYTKFENGEKVESIENRLVTFPSNLKHTGSTNTCNNPYRIVLNINYV